MAMKTVYKSDVSGAEINNVAHVSVTIDNKTFVLDIDADNIDQELGDITLAEAIERGRKGDIKARRSRRRTQASTQPGLHSEARAWALENNIEVSERGAVAKHVLDQYIAAQNAAKAETQSESGDRGEPALETAAPEFSNQ